jgi:hypothetical protein
MTEMIRLYSTASHIRNTASASGLRWLIAVWKRHNGRKAIEVNAAARNYKGSNGDSYTVLMVVFIGDLQPLPIAHQVLRETRQMSRQKRQ